MAYQNLHALAFALITALIGAAANAQDTYPNRPIEMLAAYGAGSSADAIARVVANPLSQKLGQPIAVINRPGANGTIAVQALRSAPPNGYTMLLHLNGIAIDQVTKRNTSFDVRRDVTPLVKVVEGNFGLFINPSLPVKDAREFFEYLRRNPGKLNYGSSGSGGTAHLSWEAMKVAANLNIVHVPYAKGSGASQLALLAGDVQAVINDIGIYRQLVAAGKLKAIAMVSRYRAEAMPDVPTLAELNIPGLEGFTAPVWFGLFVHAQTAKPIVDKLAAEVNAVLAMAETRERLRAMGYNENMIGGGAGPQEFKEFIAAEVARAEKVVNEANIPRE